MKYIINENRLRNFLKKNFDFDLTGKIEMITSKYQIPFEFDSQFSSNSIGTMLNLYGPMYLIKYNKKMFLVQPIRKGEWMIMDPKWGGYRTELELFHELGIPNIISIGDLIDAFLDESVE